MRRARLGLVLILLGLAGGTSLWLRSSRIPAVEPVKLTKPAVPAPRTACSANPSSRAKAQGLPEAVPAARWALQNIAQARITHPHPKPKLTPKTKRYGNVRSIRPRAMAKVKLHTHPVRHTGLATLPAVQPPPERSRRVVSAVLLRAARKLKALYTKELRKRPTAGGKLTIRLAVSPEGNVVATEVIENDLRDTRFARQVCETLRTLAFPPVQESAGVEYFRQTFLFRGV